MKRRTVTFLMTAALLAACDKSPGALTGPDLAPQFGNNKNDEPSWEVNGQVDIEDILNPNIPARYHFQAKKDKNGAKGTFRYATQLLAGDLEATGRVICMEAAGNKGRVGGVVTSSNRPEFPVGHAVVWSFTDGGKNKDDADTASTLLGVASPAAAEGYCTGGLPFPENPVNGHIHLHQTGGGS